MQPGYPQGPFVNAPPPPPPSHTFRNVAIGIIAGGGMCCLLMGAVAYPAFTRYMSRAKTVEAIDRLAYLYRASGTYVTSVPPGTTAQFPASAPLTPSSVPHGTRVVDAPGTWNTPTWQALSFSMNDPHYYSYQYTSSGEGSGAHFTARAAGDLDGDGVFSTFERSGGLDANGEITGSTGVWMNHETE